MQVEDHKNNIIALRDMPVGTGGTIIGLTVTGLTRRRLLDLGFVAGTEVTSVRRSPFEDPTAYLIRGTMIALRQEDSAEIIVRKNDD